MKALLRILVVLLIGLWIAAPGAAAAQPQSKTGYTAAGAVLGLDSAGGAKGRIETSEPVRIALVLTLATLIPSVLICMTPFVRLIVVLSMVRHGFGMPETPPNQVLISIAMFLTAFTMLPTFAQVNERALQPFFAGQLSVEQAMSEGAQPMRAFMLRQVSDKDIKTVYDIARKPLPARAADVGTMELTSAFMLNELRVSFKIGFVILLPFLLIDLVVSSILLSLGMLMVPPSTLSLPIKVLMFVLIDGWSLVLEGVVGSFR
jgi:flagellar biosynthetic protein FliP